jgi:hypothetical protein
MHIFFEEEAGVAVCETCWKAINAVAIHCVLDFLGDVLSRHGIEIKSPFRFRTLK